MLPGGEAQQLRVLEASVEHGPLVPLRPVPVHPPETGRVHPPLTEMKDKGSNHDLVRMFMHECMYV